MGFLFAILIPAIAGASEMSDTLRFGPDGKVITLKKGKKGKQVIRIPNTPVKSNPVNPNSMAINTEEALNDSIEEVRESLFPGKSPSLAFSHFTWGAEVGASIDMTANNMSSIDADVVLGFKNSFIKLAGVGAGIRRSIRNGNTFVPVYGVIRTSFTRRPSICFLNLQAGYSFNTFESSDNFGNFVCALGIGFNLMQTRMAKSYIIASCGFQHYCDHHSESIGIDTNNIYTARIVIGVNF